MYLNLLSDSRSNMSFSLKLGLPYYLHWIISLFQACMCSHSVLQSIVRQIFKNDPGVANYIMFVRISSIGCFEKNCSVDLWEDQCIFFDVCFINNNIWFTFDRYIKKESIKSTYTIFFNLHSLKHSCYPVFNRK